MPQFKVQCVFPSTDGKSPVATNKAVVSDGNALCSPTFGWVRQCGGLQIVSKSGPKIILYCPYEKFLVLRNKSDESTTYCTLGLHHIFLAGEKWEFEFFFEFPLRDSLFFWLLDLVNKPLQLDCITICLLNFLHIWLFYWRQGKCIVIDCCVDFTLTYPADSHSAISHCFKSTIVVGNQPLGN